MSKAREFMQRFFTTNTSDETWMSVLRIGAALALLGKLLSEIKYRDALYGSDGLVPPDIAAYSQTHYIPTVLGIYRHLPFHCQESHYLAALFICGILMSLSLLTGYMTRISAFLCWILMITLFNSSHLTSYGFDAILLTLLFYCLTFPVGRYHSLDSMIRPNLTEPDRSLTGVFHKTVQLHVCLIYFVNGISKVHGHSWQDGSGLFDAIHQPQFHSAITMVLIRLFMLPLVPQILSISVLVIEIAYPFLIWVRRARKAIFILIIMLHVSIAVVMGLWLFAFAMIVLNMVAFGNIKADTTPVLKRPDIDA